MDIGDKIKQLRTERNLTQEELAAKLAIARSTLACYETNKNQVSNEFLVALAKFFQVTTDYLLGLED